MQQPDHIKRDMQRFYTGIRKTLERQIFEKITYDENFFRDTERYKYECYPYLNELMEFNLHIDERILEIGVGQGVDHSMFTRNGADTYGIDLTFKHLEITGKRFDFLGLKPKLTQADAEQLPFRDNSFDLVYSWGVIHHVPDMQSVINEIHRVLKPGGKVIAMFYHKNSIWFFHNILFFKGIVLGELQFLTYKTLLNWHSGDGYNFPLAQYVTKRSLKKLFKHFENHKFYITNYDQKHLPYPIHRFFTEGMFTFFSRYIGFFITIKAQKGFDKK
ncbi:MAG: class I SAM-dependent methyltransferase [bacterium]